MTDPIEPRHLWRRIFAFVVDIFVSSVIAGLVVFPLVLALPKTFHLSDGPIKAALCREITGLPPEVTELIAGREVASARFCGYRPNLVFPQQYRAEIKVIEPQEDGSRVKWTTEYTFHTTEDGTIITPLFLDAPLRDAVLLFGSAFLLARGKRSPGKRLLGLKVVGSGKPLLRELLRVGPILALSLLAFFAEIAFRFAGGPAVLSPTLLIVAGAPLAIAFLAYYVLPFIRWRGSMPYDRVTGFVVMRSNAAGHPEMRA